MLRVSDIVKSYNGTIILAGVSFQLAAGEKALLLGSNGAGKSTLLRIIANLIHRDAGTVLVGGIDPTRETAQAALVFGYVGHASLLYQDLTVEENLRYYAALYRLSPKETRHRVAARLDEIGLAARRRAFVRTLSQGQLKRLSIARALLHEPPLLLLDEPFATLDVPGRQWLATLLSTDSARTVLVATHQLDFSPQAADRVLMLNDGQISNAYKEALP